MPGKSRIKFRRCQECGVVNQANAFKRVLQPDVISVERKVVCPSCGYTAPAWAFLEVEQSTQAEGNG